MEGIQITWADDVHIANAMVHTTIKSFRQNSSPLISLFKVYKDLDDKKFTEELFRKTIRHQSETKNIIEEIKLYPKIEYTSIYFGGGTPSLLSLKSIESIMNSIQYKEDSEITLELNPKNMTLQNLQELRKLGINRLSIGTQSFNDKILKTLGRDHSAEDAIETYRNAIKSGFDNISLDLIFATPNQTIEELRNDLEKIKELRPNHISIYSLIWEEGTYFWKQRKEGKLSEISEDLEAEMFEEIITTLTNEGYIHYEISSFCKPGFESIHNSKYWDNKEFIGVGSGASSYFEGKRYSNKKKIYKYYEDIKMGIRPIDIETIEEIDETEKVKLSKMLGLRRVDKGIIYDKNDEAINKLISKQLLVLENDRVRLTYKGVFLANDVFVEFI